MAGGYLPWWLGAAALALITVGSCIVARRPLGVSGILGRFVNLPSELASDRARAAAGAHAEEFDAELLAATAEAFPSLVATWPEPAETPAVVSPALARAPATGAACDGGLDPTATLGLPTVSGHALFLGGVVAGGFLVSALRGAWHLSLDMGPDFGRLIGRGGTGLAALAAGGLLVGAGSAISGGCSTGHGLSGCSRLQPGSVAATATFLAAAVATSFLVGWAVP